MQEDVSQAKVSVEENQSRLTRDYSRNNLGNYDLNTLQNTLDYEDISLFENVGKTKLFMVLSSSSLYQVATLYLS